MKPVHIVLEVPEEKIPTGASRFWGNPDLPSDVEYPAHADSDGYGWEYQFICQINLADIAAYDTENRLPHKGLLSFFARIDHYMGYDDEGCISGYVSGPEDLKVLYFPEVTDDFSEVVLLDEDDKPVNPSELTMKFAQTRPEGCYEDHALLAEPTHREWETWEPPFEDWQILLQVDSFTGKDFDLNFMDCGVLDFLISPEDLAAGRFDSVRAIVLSA